MVYEVLKIGEENALSPEYLKNILHVRFRGLFDMIRNTVENYN